MSRHDTWLVAAALAVSAGSSVIAAPAPGKPGAAPPPPALVTVAPVVRKAMPVEIRTFGTVVARATVELRAQIGGLLTQVHVADGATVKEGDLMFTIDPRPAEAALRQAEANLARNRVQAAQAARESARQQELLDKGLAAADDFEQARTAAEALSAAVRADEAAVTNALLQLEYCTIRAPIAGRAGEILVRAGNLVRPGDAVLTTIRRLQPIYVDLAVPEAELPAIQRAMASAPPAVRVFAPSSPDAVETGRLVFVDNTVDRATGTIRLRGEFENAALRLWPGQFVQAVLVRDVVPDALVVPTRAVQNGQKGSYVFVLTPEGTVDQRPVTVIRAGGEETVVAGGVKEGEPVVTDGQLRLVPGGRAQVAVTETGPATPKKQPAP